jgi:hypothetical protein
VKKYGDHMILICYLTNLGALNTMVPSELTRRVGMGELLVLFVFWKSGPYGVPDQQGDTLLSKNGMLDFQLRYEFLCEVCRILSWRENIFVPAGKARDIEVEGIQGSGPQIVFWGDFSPNSPDHGDNPPPCPSPLPSAPSPLLH